jgi:putative tryptophan/tyrosine transport system substrate-binding protein
MATATTVFQPRPLASPRRRVAALLAAGLALPRWAVAQSARRTARLGILDFGEPGKPTGETEAFFRELAQRGFVEGANLQVDRRYADNDPKRLRGLADELVALRPDVIFTVSGTVGALAAKAATTTIPIVFDASNDPVGRGLVADLARPGGNLTGTRVFSNPQDLKRLQMLVEVVKAPRCVAVLDAAVPTARKQEYVAAFTGLGLGPRSRLIFVEAPRVEDLPATFESMRAEQVDAVVIPLSPFTVTSADRIAALIATYRLPAIADGRRFTEGGLLLTYNTDWVYLYRRGADYVSRVLNGVSPAELPIEQVARFELVINLKTAKLLGIQVPRSMRLLADVVIE